MWVSLGDAADYMGVSEDTVGRRAIPWQDTPSPGRLRYKLLKLGENTRMERRYYVPDLKALIGGV